MNSGSVHYADREDAPARVRSRRTGSWNLSYDDALLYYGDDEPEEQKPKTSRKARDKWFRKRREE